MAQLWHTILARMNMTSKMLQSLTLDINNAVALLSSLKEFIESLRAQFDVFEERQIVGNNQYLSVQEKTREHP